MRKYPIILENFISNLNQSNVSISNQAQSRMQSNIKGDCLLLLFHRKKFKFYEKNIFRNEGERFVILCSTKILSLFKTLFGRDVKFTFYLSFEL